MTDEELTLVHILEYFSRKAARAGRPVPRKESRLRDYLPEDADLELFYRYLEKEFHVELDEKGRELVREGEAKNLAFYISRVLKHPAT